MDTSESVSKSKYVDLTGLPKLVRLLVVSDVDIRSAAELADFAVRDADFNNSLNVKSSVDGENDVYSDGIDLCLACGPFVRKSGALNENLNDASDSTENCDMPLELDIANEGVMSCVLAQLENIVCRLLYVPCKTYDSLRTHSDYESNEAPNLTPNSRNVNNIMLPTLYGLGVSGIADYSSNDMSLRRDQKAVLEKFKNNLGAASSYHERSRQVIILSTHSYDIIEEENHHRDKYTEIVNGFLSSKELQSKVMLYVNRAQQQNYSSRGEIGILSPGSLRSRGEFALVDLRPSNLGQLWNIDKVHLRNYNTIKRI